MKKFVIGLLIIFALAACASGSSASLQGQWKLVSYNQTPAAPDVETNIEFNSEGRMSGNVGCNSFGGDYTIDGETIKFGPVMSTMMACIGPVGDQEAATLQALQEKAGFMLEGNTLTITSANGSSSIVLERK